jgi:hypothetical protein
MICHQSLASVKENDTVLEYRGIHDLLTLAGAFAHECVIDHRKHTIGTNMTLIRDIVKITC